MMNIVVVCFLQVFYSRMRWCVNVYTNLVHDVLQKRYVLQGTYFSGLICYFLVSLSIVPFLFVWWSISLAVVHCPLDAFHMELICMLCACFCIPCMHDMCYVCPGFDPLTLSHNRFDSSRVRTPDCLVRSF